MPLSSLCLGGCDYFSKNIKIITLKRDQLRGNRKRYRQNMLRPDRETRDAFRSVGEGWGEARGQVHVRAKQNTKRVVLPCADRQSRTLGDGD